MLIIFILLFVSKWIIFYYFIIILYNIYLFIIIFYEYQNILFIVINILIFYISFVIIRIFVLFLQLDINLYVRFEFNMVNINVGVMFLCFLSLGYKSVFFVMMEECCIMMKITFCLNGCLFGDSCYYCWNCCYWHLSEVLIVYVIR
jgi:hypothetical protein